MERIFQNITKEFVKENFSSYQETKNLWVEAGGKASMISDTHDANVRWGDLFRKIEAGAVEPIKLILVALEIYPFNKVLLSELKNLISDNVLVNAKSFIDDQDQSSIALLNGIPTEHAAAAVTVALTENIQPNILDNRNADPISQSFKQSFANKAGEMIAIAGGAAWLQVVSQLISSVS
ncbi:hypothetical protein F909_01845 [Acinetobacter sp. ANC 3929]|uniref:hypothetical protein n=1 Tax=Acinetobacter TaxID=469 RepID=UPI0002CF7326|nr:MULTISPECIES: hypothetical protein [Acinetobacter]ENW80559.1 hypothetical protein F909_01845 [Acinetobacter sp. ANC 3929]MCH7354040.1 hypothetical protein [Acinetobacter sp. NIPH 1958]